MKKAKTFLKIFAAMISVLLAVFIFDFCSSGYTYKIKMENGDYFTVNCDSWGESYIINNLEHNFCNPIKYFGSKDDIKLFCDTEYFRCYKLQNKSVNMYICGLKPDGDYFWINIDEKYAQNVFKQKYSEEFKKVFLADKYIMEVTLNYMDDVYHKEMQEMAKKLTSGNYEGLEQYGLTQEMINDKESLDEKIKIMEDYLNNVPRTELNK